MVENVNGFYIVYREKSLMILNYVVLFVCGMIYDKIF